MLIVLWLLNAALALAFLAAGLQKAIRSQKALAAAGMGWTIDAPPSGVKILGLLEVAGSLGLVLPLATGVAAFLAPAAAVGLTLMMCGATLFHLKRGETPLPSAILGVATAASAVIGFITLP
ncbi:MULTISPECIES: DoxX family protein [Arthrobacter]|uniref:Membrane protein YphA (DoxX/SURF4 family) n=1 Tax=Arthrobacter bambusae TaxID=1338426 RepID=A0AAW8DHL8_9MICC|nr:MULTISPECIES: DoxX family protein [Arthrobacter]MDP9907280.1 putative membrane protein YphA (DoxX/SURF4 family) [Arthrobacter bambusae]MDQ0131416.1 putative membrane protein YphA (DoxX/SURF4 family) [Arthrobacter bambusae]MDQ0182750.1 putative membrane protein YphA (DoxX/SURF4 family) [Arthrobacter bambusae]